MRIGTQDDYLKIEPCDPDDPHSAYVMEARTTESHAAFYGKNEAVMFSVSDSLKADFETFRNFQRNDLKIVMTEGCGLDLSRDLHGNILVKYRRWWKYRPFV